MKKLLALALALILTLSFFVSCDSGDTGKAPETTDSSVNNGSDSPEETAPSEEDLLQQMIDNPEKGSVMRDIVPLGLNSDYRTNAGDGAYTFVYEKVELTAYNDLCNTLKEKNFLKYSENEFNSAKSENHKNYFATYLSKITQISLEYHATAKRMYVTATPRTASVLPTRGAPSYTAVGAEYPTIMTQYGLEDIDNQGSSMGYIIRIADGSFVIFDGGENYPGVAERMYSILKKQAPDPNNIVISAWIITHADFDHRGAFNSFASLYGKSSDVTIKQMVYNFPDASCLNSTDVDQQKSVRKSVAELGDSVELLRPHTGDVLRYADVTFNVLYTQENYLAVSKKFGNYNTSSLVMQMITKDGTKVLIGADHPVNGTYEGVKWCEGAIYNWYGDFIESYVATTFHHGFGGGADDKVYDVIRPKIVLWCAEQYRIDLNNLTKNSFNKYFAAPNAASKGVSCYIGSGSRVQIVSFADGKANVTQYDTIAEYLASK